MSNSTPRPDPNASRPSHARAPLRARSKPRSDYAIQTVSNALRILESFCAVDAEDELGVSELSRRLDLHKNNVFRLLATLEQGGYIEQSDSSDRYRLGTRCLELGQAFSRRHTLLCRARPILEELVRKVGETAHVAVLRDFEVVHLDGVMPDQMILTALRVGQRLPAHCTALGKVLVGCGETELREEYSRSVVASEGLDGRTAVTILDPPRLEEELSTVSSEGLALDLEECETGMHCVAAPVHDAGGRVIAAISISGPAFRLSEADMRGGIGRAVTASAEQLSQELGYGL